jgi:hypothetical protein
VFFCHEILSTEIETKKTKTSAKVLHLTNIYQYLFKRKMKRTSDTRVNLNTIPFIHFHLQLLQSYTKDCPVHTANTTGEHLLLAAVEVVLVYITQQIKMFLN